MKRISYANLAAWFQPLCQRQTLRLTRWAVLSCLAIASVAGAVELDTTFGVGGKRLLSLPSDSPVQQVAIAHLPMPDGGSMVVYGYRDFGSCPAHRECVILERFTATDQAFPMAILPVTTNFAYITAAAIDAQGRVVVVGSRQYSGQDYDMQIVRALPSGVLDTTFNGSGIQSIGFDVGRDNYDSAHDVAIDSSNRIVVAGIAETSEFDTDIAIARLAQNGSLDVSFNATGKRLIEFKTGSTSSINKTVVAIDSTDRIVIGGEVWDTIQSVYLIGLARLMPNGSYDTGFCDSFCAYNPYPAINHGRRVAYFSDLTQARHHSIGGIAVNGGNVIAIGGGYYVGGGRPMGYTMTFEANGNYLGEREITGGIPQFPGEAQVADVAFVSPTASNSDLIVTGIKGNLSQSWTYFFAQRLTSTLSPRTTWNGNGGDTSVFWFYAQAPMVANDPWGDKVIASTVDSAGRVLMAGLTPYDGSWGMAARLTGDVIFRDGFE